MLQKERTLVIIKPDGVQRTLIGEIIKRIERTGMKIVGLKMFVADRARAEKHYGKDDAWCTEKGQTKIDNMKKVGEEPTKSALEYGRDIIETVINYMSVGPVVGMVIEGAHSVHVVKKLVGATQPMASDVGTIRGDFTMDSYAFANLAGRAVRNLIHCTDDPAESQREIDIWFSKDEIIDYRLIQEQMLYDVNIDGILE